MLRVGCALWALLLAAPVCAQVSGSVGVLSDYRYRGVSLSDQRPAVQLAVAYDHADGGYAGLLLSSVRLTEGDVGSAQWLPYLGIARRLRPGLNAEFGAQYTHFSGASGRSYAELYIGLSSDHFNGRLYYAPDYLGKRRNVYAEFNGTRRLSEHLRVLGHIGVLRFNGVDRRRATSDSYRVDLRVGLAMELQAFDLQLSRNFTLVDDDLLLRNASQTTVGTGQWVLGLSMTW